MSYKYYVRFNGSSVFLGYPAYVPERSTHDQTVDYFRRILRSMDRQLPDRITDFYFCNGSQIRFYLRRRSCS